MHDRNDDSKAEMGRRDAEWSNAQRTALQHSPDNITLLDREGVIRYTNWAVAGVSPEGVVGSELSVHIPESQRAKVAEVLAQVATTGQPGRYATPYFSPDDSISMWESRVGPVVRNGSVEGFVVVSSDVTERRATAAERDRLFELSIDILGVADSEGRIKQINPAFQRALGHPTDEIVGRPYLDFVHPDDRAQVGDQLRRLQSGDSIPGFRSRYRTTSGSYRVISWHVIPDPQNNVLYGVGRDVTDAELLEDKLRESQKLDAIGQLAGGVAHDFNNLLLAILANTDFTLKQLGDDHPLAEHLLQVRRAGNRAAELTRQLLTFSRREPTRRIALDLNELTQSLMAMLRRLIPEDIDIEFVACEQLGTVAADPTQLEQAIVNLVVNARDALPKGGHIRITTSEIVVGDGGDADRQGLVSGRYALLQIADTGVGMPPETQARIFEPFFTTKETGKGTGLGLATLYGMVQHLGGTVQVRSAVGQGTSFDIYLPTTEASPESVRDGHAPGIAPGEGTVLLAEDEELVRNVVVAMLERGGYRVITAEDGAQAVELFRKHSKEVDLVMLDVVMPNLSGPDAYDQMREVNADLPALFTSGYADAGRARNSMPETSVVLQKPYQVGELLRRVRKALDSED